ncbi:MAG TPA: hypothetical protein DHW49_08720 [Anaerolineae bacterium]|nr:hypothetical protein [Anaerolineae bacterium]
MAKVKLTPIIEEIHGKLGEETVFRRTHTGGVSLIKKADMSKVKWSKAQKAHRARFKQAVAYAKSAMADVSVRKVYEKQAKKLNKRPFDLAVSDYFKGNNLLKP